VVGRGEVRCSTKKAIVGRRLRYQRRGSRRQERGIRGHLFSSNPAVSKEKEERRVMKDGGGGLFVGGEKKGVAWPPFQCVLGNRNKSSRDRGVGGERGGSTPIFKGVRRPA